MIQNISKITRIAFGLFCLVIGIDKFFPFLGGCTLFAITPTAIWMLIGVVQLGTGISLIINKYVGLALILLISLFGLVILAHLFNDTYDIGGAFFGLVATASLYYSHKKNDPSNEA